MQTAAEYDTLCRIAYSQARCALCLALANQTQTAALEQISGFERLPPAIIVDLDETVLDNSRFQGQLALDRSSYSEAKWQDWVKLHSAGAVPGAVEFINFATSQGVTVFYVTNRDKTQETDTRLNLEALQLPLPAIPDVVLSKGDTEGGSDKTYRRAEIAKNYRVLLLIGDDLGDFVSGAKALSAVRMGLARKHENRWGSQWILIPNALYGSWEQATYNNDLSLSDPKVLAKKFSYLKGF